jgi:hypothetical protein
MLQMSPASKAVQPVGPDNKKQTKIKWLTAAFGNLKSSKNCSTWSTSKLEVKRLNQRQVICYASAWRFLPHSMAHSVRIFPHFYNNLNLNIGINSRLGMLATLPS